MDRELDVYGPALRWIILVYFLILFYSFQKVENLKQSTIL